MKICGVTANEKSILFCRVEIIGKSSWKFKSWTVIHQWLTHIYKVWCSNATWGEREDCYKHFSRSLSDFSFSAWKFFKFRRRTLVWIPLNIWRVGLKFMSFGRLFHEESVAGSVETRFIRRNHFSSKRKRKNSFQGKMFVNIDGTRLEIVSREIRWS